MSNLRELAAALRFFEKFADMPHPASGLPGTGLGNSPRLTDMQTAVLLSPEHYADVLALRDVVVELTAQPCLIVRHVEGLTAGVASVAAYIRGHLAYLDARWDVQIAAAQDEVTEPASTADLGELGFKHIGDEVYELTGMGLQGQERLIAGHGSINFEGRVLRHYPTRAYIEQLIAVLRQPGT